MDTQEGPIPKLLIFPPFISQDTNETFAKIKALSFSFPSPWWDDVSNSAKDLICHCLDPGLYRYRYNLDIDRERDI